MKRFFILMLAVLSLLVCTSALADDPLMVLGEDNIRTLEAKYTDYDIVSAYRFDNNNVVVSMHKDQGRNLMVLVQNNKVTYAGSGAVPQGDAVYVGMDSACSAADHLWHFTAIQGDGTDTQTAACHYYTDRNGEFRLGTYRVNGVVITVSNDRLDYAGTIVRGTIENRLKHVNIASLPKTASAARKYLSTMPEIPDGTLSAKSIEFAAGKAYAVYSAPDANSLRGAAGKAKVSTNDWVQVFGRDGEWIMVQYDITANHFRIGYIPASSLPTGVIVPSLEYTGTGAVTSYAVKVTDDPLNSQAELLEIPADTQVMVLGSMGTWSYIEGTDKGVRYRGFVPAESLTVSNVITSEQEARQLLAGVWTVLAGGADNADSLEFYENGSVHGHFYSKEHRGAISAMELIADGELNSDWDGSWMIHTYDTALQLYWNDPEFELTITRNGEQKHYGMRICWEPYGVNGPNYALILSTEDQNSTGLVLCK